MARTVVGRALTEQHRQGQIKIRAGALRDFVRLWPLWQGDSRSFRRLVDATIPLVRVHRQLSGTFAAAYYTAFRDAERAGGEVALRVAPAPDVDAVIASLYVTGEGMTRKAIAAGLSPQAAMQNALVRTSGSVTRHVLEGGRQTLVESTRADRQTQGWARVTSGNCCAFCAMLASRGPAYSEAGADFESHDHCTCFAEPSYEGSEWPGRAREFHDLWNAKADGDLNQFRRVLEGRA